MRAVVVLAVVGCVDSSVVVCGDDRVCPAEYACDEIHGLCVLPEQLEGCAEGSTDTCTLPGDRTGACDQGVCLAIVCGDGIVAGLEQCEPGDGATYECTDHDYYEAKTLTCAENCTFPEFECTGTCGDGILNGPPGTETCDVGIDPPSTCLDFGYEGGRISCNTSACGPDLSACRNIGWVPFFATVGQSFNAIHPVGPDHVFVAESGTGVLEVHGATTTRTDLGTSVLGLWANSPTDVYAVGGGSSIFHFDGTTWATQRPVTTMGLFGVWATGNVAYAVGTGGQILKTTGGGTWVSDDTSANNWNAVFGTSTSSIHVVGWSGAIRKYNGTMWSNENASACWGADTPPMLRGVWSSGPSNIFVVGNSGYICHFNGSAWSRQPSGTLEQLNAVWGRAPDDVFVVGGAGTVLHYDGHRWRAVDSEVPVGLFAVRGAGTDLYIAGAAGTARRHAGATLSFESFVSAGQPEPVVSLDTDDAREFLVTNDQALTRASGTWDPIFTSDGNFSATWLAPDGTLFVTASTGLLMRTAAGVETTEPPSTFGDQSLNEVAGRSSTDLVVGVAGEPTTYHRSGGSWTAHTLPGNGLATDLSCGPTVTFAVGYDDSVGGGRAFRFVQGTGWTDMTLPANTPTLQSVVAISDTLVFAVGAAGTILRSMDGQTFTAMDSGTSAFFVDVTGTAADDAFAGAPGTLLHFDGTSWLPVRVPLDTNGVLAVRPDAIHLGGTNEVVVIERDPSW